MGLLKKAIKGVVGTGIKVGLDSLTSGDVTKTAKNVKNAITGSSAVLDRRLNGNIEPVYQYTIKNFDSFAEISRELKDKCVDENEKLRDLQNKLELCSGWKDKRKIQNDIYDAERQLESDLSYLYLSRDYFSFLSMHGNGMELSDEKINLIKKFAPYFGGVPVLEKEANDEWDDEDYSLFGTVKEIGSEFKEIFISSKKKIKKFSMEEYLEDVYGDKMREYVIPDIDGAINSFLKTSSTEKVPESIDQLESAKADSEMICPSCGKSIARDSMFCPKCGTRLGKLECNACGATLKPGDVFCSKCGAKTGL